VTEYSKAHLKNTNIRQWAECIITSSPPDFWAELWQEADKLMLW